VSSRQAAFDQDTALAPVDKNEFRGSIAERWLAGGPRSGPHGGYLAALVLRGLTMTLDDPSRAPLTLTVSSSARPPPGPSR
jgi:hypothetical protein